MWNHLSGVRGRKMTACFLIFRHELTKLFSDRKLLASIFLMPVFIVFLMGMMLSIMPESSEASSCVYVLHQVSLEPQEGLDMVIVSCATLEQLQKQRELKPSDVVLDLKDTGADIYYWDTNTESYRTAIQCRQMLFDRQLTLFAEEKQIPMAEELPVVDLNDTVDMRNAMVASILPYLLVLLLFQSTRAIAVDTIAGEKDRGVFDRYLMAPVRPMSVVTGKLLFSAVCATASGICYFLAVAVCSAVTGKDSFGLSGACITGSMVGVLFLFSIILSCFTAAIAVLISLWAKTEKEAQSMLLPVLVVFTIAAFAAMLRTGTAFAVSYLIPVYNLCILMQDVLYGATQTQHLMLAAVSLTGFFIATFAGIAQVLKWKQG